MSKNRLDKRQPDLWEALMKSGIVASDKPYVARARLNYWIKAGKFDYPLETRGHVRIYSQQMIDDIIAAFSPGGSGRWSVKDYARRK